MSSLQRRPDVPPQAASQEDAAKRRLESILESITDGFIAFDREWRFTYVNRRAEEFYGHPRNELLGERVWDLFPQLADSVFQQEYRRAVREQVSIDFEAESVLKSGLWLEVRAFPLDEGLSIYFKDVSERKRVTEALRESEERFRLMVEGSEQVFFYMHDLENRFTYLSPSVEAVLGYRPAELVGRSYESTLTGDPSDEVVRQETEAALKRGERRAAYPAVIRHRDGRTLVAEIVETPVFQDGQVVAMQGFARDITERRTAETELRDSEARYRSLFEDSRDAIYLTSRNGELVEANQSFLRLFEYSREELIGRAATDLYVQAADRARFQRAIERSGGVKEFEVKLKTRSGRLIDCLVTSSVRLSPEGEILGYQGIIHDITDRKRAEHRLVHNAFHDSLTGLPNRALLTDRLGVLLDRSRRSPAGFAVFFLDLDRFKVINDSLGHLIGDQLLVTVAQRLAECLRAGDTVARFGGDEFVMLLDGVDTEEDVRDLAAQVQAAVRAPVELEGHETVVTASIGIALGSPRYQRSDDILRDADIAMYRAKAEGRQRIQIFDVRMHDEAVARLRLENDLRRALEREELRVRFQPIVSLERGVLAGFEALVRWQHPEQGLLRPAQFLDIAEETGLIVSLGWWMLENACREHLRWRELSGDHPLSIHVNLSGRQFEEPGLVRRIEELLDRYRMPPGSLTVEITESVLMETAPALIGTMRRLKLRGVRLCIDDFGVGYSSLSYLHRFPIDTVKIDHSFVRGAIERKEDAAIIHTVVTLGKTIGMAVIPEGVETAPQAAKLLELGCTLAQGYYYGRPLAAAAALDRVKQAFTCSGTG